MDDRDKILIVGEGSIIATLQGREAALAALYPNEPCIPNTTIVFGDDLRIAEADRELRALKREARERERRRLMLADFDRAHPTTEADHARIAAAEAKRARRRARNTR